jgi:hypothetical protein
MRENHIIILLYHVKIAFTGPKGLDPIVDNDEFFRVGQCSIPVRALPGAMGAP